MVIKKIPVDLAGVDTGTTLQSAAAKNAYLCEAEIAEILDFSRRCLLFHRHGTV